jgi:hypothetical protein
MTSDSKTRLKWDREAINKAIKECKTLTEFRKVYPGAYAAAVRYNWKDLYSSLPRETTPQGYWTLEKLQQEASKYQSRTEFQKGSQGAYTKAHRIGCLDEICRHMKPTQHPSGYWTRERILRTAKRYKSRIAFHRGAESAYPNRI